MQQKVPFVMTHDSIGLGEDDQRINLLNNFSLRAIPNLNVFRPADTIETYEAWELALESNKTPSVLALTRQKVEPVRKMMDGQNKVPWSLKFLEQMTKLSSLFLQAALR